jgi:hypothetical protein
MQGREQRVIYFEHIVLGASVKVTAIDSVTAVEVSVIGPAGAAKHDLERLALRKLEARLKRDQPP